MASVGVGEAHLGRGFCRRCCCRRAVSLEGLVLVSCAGLVFLRVKYDVLMVLLGLAMNKGRTQLLSVCFCAACVGAWVLRLMLVMLGRGGGVVALVVVQKANAIPGGADGLFPTFVPHRLTGCCEDSGCRVVVAGHENFAVRSAVLLQGMSGIPSRGRCCVVYPPSPCLLRLFTGCSSVAWQAMPLKTDDPMQYYTDMRKLGQGASGTVFVGTDVRTGEVRFVFPFGVCVFFYLEETRTAEVR